MVFLLAPGLMDFGYGREFACWFSFKMTSKNKNQVELQMRNVAWYSCGLIKYMLVCSNMQESVLSTIVARQETT